VGVARRCFFFGRLSAGCRWPLGLGRAAETAGTGPADAFTTPVVVSGLVTAAAFAVVLLLTLACQAGSFLGN